MPVRYLEAHPYVTENTGRVALARGPLLYCVEGTDPDPRELVVSRDLSLAAEHLPDFLAGVTVLTGQAERLEPDAWNGALYSVAGEAGTITEVALTTIPYFAWAYLEPAPMLVRLRRTD